MKYTLPNEIADIISELEKAGYEAYAVGGAVRDLLLGRSPKDWDVATIATPAEIQKVFPDSLYENKFGTVTVRTSGKIKEVEVTTYRIDEEYSDKRHPDKVKFTKSLEEDLARRDFTINAIAMKTKKHENKKTKEPNDELEINIIDPFKGQRDIEDKLIRSVGNASDRFNEDALRLLRAVRLATELGFEIESKTYNAIKDSCELLNNISAERIRDEFVKIINSTKASDGVRLLADSGLLEVFIPELAEGIGVAQNKHHKFDVFEHLVRSLEYAAKKDYFFEIRLAALFHDMGKPQSKRGKGEAATFYNHEMISAKQTKQIMGRLKFSSSISEKVYQLVRWHQFYYQSEEVTASSVRRLLVNVGKENIDDLLKVREADRIGSGVPKAVPYKLRHLKFMVEKVSTDPVSVKMLKVNGDELIKELGLKPSPKLGLILNSLLSGVIDDPKVNKKETLIKRAKGLNESSEIELKKNLAKIKKAQDEQEEEMKQKYYVK